MMPKLYFSLAFTDMGGKLSFIHLSIISIQTVFLSREFCLIYSDVRL